MTLMIMKTKEPAQQALKFAFFYLVASSCERDLSAPVVVKGEWDEQVKDRSCLALSCGEMAFIAQCPG